MSSSAQLYGLALAIITVPILVHGLGVAAYGLYIVANVLLSYSVVLDVGMTTTLVWAVAQHSSIADRDKLERLIGTALSLLIALGLVAGIVVATLTTLASDSVLKVPTSLRADARFVLYMAALGITINLCLSVFYAVPQGLQRLDLLAKRNVLLSTCTAAAQIFAVSVGAGVRWVIVIGILANACSLIVFALLSSRLLPGLTWRPRLDRWALHQLGSFGVMKFVNQLASQLVFQADRLILAAFLPISAVTFYSIPLSIAQRLFVFQGAIGGSFFPAASELSRAHDVARLHRIYLSTMKLVMTITLPTVVLVGGFSQGLLDAWLGRSFAGASANILLVVMIAYGLVSILGIPALASDATGNPQWTAAFSVISAILNVSVTVVLVQRIGAIGAAWALVFNSVLQAVPFALLVQRRFLKVPFTTVFAKSLARPLLAGGVLLAYTILLRGRVTGALPTLAALVTGAVLYVALALLVRIWDADELHALRSLRRSIWGPAPEAG